MGVLNKSKNIANQDTYHKIEAEIKRQKTHKPEHLNVMRLGILYDDPQEYKRKKREHEELTKYHPPLTQKLS